MLRRIGAAGHQRGEKFPRDAVAGRAPGRLVDQMGAERRPGTTSNGAIATTLAVLTHCAPEVGCEIQRDRDVLPRILSPPVTGTPKATGKPSI